MRFVKKPLLILLICLSSVPSVSETVDHDRVYEIANRLMCPVCRGQTVAHSNSDLAKDMREIIKKKLAKGESEKQILSYFSNRYGDSVLASPPKKGVNLLLWLLPVISLGVGFIAIIYFLRNEAYTDKEVSGTADNINTYDKEIFNRINKELEKDI